MWRYRRRDPDYPWRRRRPVRCFLADLTRGHLFHHVTNYDRLWARGERWATFLFFCERCQRLTGPSHAAPADEPVDVSCRRS